MKITDKITKHLIPYCRSGSYDIVVQNYFYGLWEMDVMKITSAGYVIEYEVKVSKSDFNNDFKKIRHGWMKTTEGYGAKEYKKHQDIIDGKRCNRFYFVVPEDLISPEEVPEHAGLIYYSNGYFKIVKNAKLIHKNTFSNYKELAVKLCFREETLRIKISQKERLLKKKISESFII